MGQLSPASSASSQSIVPISVAPTRHPGCNRLPLAIPRLALGGTEPIRIHSFMQLSIRHSAYFRRLLIRILMKANPVCPFNVRLLHAVWEPRIEVPSKVFASLNLLPSPPVRL